MLIRGLDARVTDLARGVLVLRSTRLLSPDEQVAILARLAESGMTEPPDHERGEGSPRQLVAIPWAPPGREELERHRTTTQALAEAYDIDAAWFVKVETAVDGVAWQELAASAPVADDDDADGDDDDDDDDDDADDDDDDDDDDEGEDEGGEGDVAEADQDDRTADDAAGARAASGTSPDGADDDERTGRPSVLYAAPDAPPDVDEDDTGPGDGDDDDDDDDGDDDDGTDDWSTDPGESHWRNGPPPTESAVSFALEHYPEILEDFDWEDFGVAVKLGGDRLDGEDSVVNAFFALWLSAYQDERLPQFEAFQGADVIHDRERRSALLWIERFVVPASGPEQIHFLMWILGRLHEVLPIAWARFDQSDVSLQARDGERGTFVLAGNPLGERFHRLGEAAALAWATSQTLWDRREIAAMLIELALSHDPEQAADAATAERLLLRAIGFDPRSEAKGYLCTVLIRQGRFAEALAHAASDDEPELRGHFLAETLQYAPEHTTEALALVPGALMTRLDDADLAELATRVADKAPDQLEAYLERLPARVTLVPHLYNASFPVERARGLAILSRVITLPEPPPSDETARAAYVMAWNNACIHAHALGDYARACAIAEGAQRFASENPYIFHSAACAFAAAGDAVRALEQVGKAIEHGYDHIEKMEMDRDLGALLTDPRFHALFADWRAQRADLN